MTTPQLHTRTDVEGAFRPAADAFTGELVLPDHPDYEAARRVWNLLIDRRPAVIARCAERADVARALRAARELELPVAVRGGGHSFAGHSTCDDGVVIDLGQLRNLTVDPTRRLAVAEPGLTWGEVTSAAQRHGLAAVGGHVSNVGIAGLTLGGGVGWLARAHGLACDNLVEAEVVTADGSVLRASAEENADLFWGLRGGGGNFGVVTRFVLRLHPVTTLFGGMVIHPHDRAPEVLRFLRDFGADAPDEVNVMAALLTAPPEPFVPAGLQGRPAVALAACHTGSVEDGERALAPLRELGPPAVDLCGPMPFPQLQQLFDAMGRPTAYHVKSELLGPLDDAALDRLVEHTRVMPSPTSAVLVIPLGGAVARVPADATAFRHRQARYNLEVCAAWDPAAAAGERLTGWAEQCWEAMRPWSAGVEVNHLGDEGPDRVRAAYGEDTYARLAGLKRDYDPDNVFRLNQNVPPRRSTSPTRRGRPG